MSGMLSLVSPAATVDGSVSDLSGCALGWHAVTLMCSSRRHFPTCKTSGTLLPTGTLPSLKLPSTPVATLTTAPLLKSA